MGGAEVDKFHAMQNSPRWSYTLSIVWTIPGKVVSHLDRIPMSYNGRKSSPLTIIGHQK